MYGVTITVPDLIGGYKDVVDTVVQKGLEVSPRGDPTLELIGATVVITNPELTLPVGVGRGVSKVVAAMETLQLIGGFTDPVLTCRASDAFEKVKDGGAFHGAYGPRTAPQFPRVVERLKSDGYTRRAVVNIWDPAQDLYRDGLHDYPCTITLEYTIRNGALVASTHMRSNDVWLGLAYDAFVFTQVQLTLCNILQVDPGPYVHHATSLHIYERDVPKVGKLTADPWLTPKLPKGLLATSWTHAQAMAHDVVYSPKAVPLSYGADWYLEALEKIR